MRRRQDSTHSRLLHTVRSGRSASPPSSARAAPAAAPAPRNGGEDAVDDLLLFTKQRSAPDTTPTSVLEVANVKAATQAAGWGAETRATTSDDAELECERVDRELEREFEEGERADRVLFAAGVRPLPEFSARGVPPHAPFMPSP